MSPTSPARRDAFGNSFEDLVRFAMSEIMVAEPEPFRYDPELYSGPSIREAVRRLNFSRAYPISAAPEAATREDLNLSQPEFRGSVDRGARLALKYA